ncbi:MAG: metal-sensing transcriptional repressor [Patescibacteria group bacterium]|mgnify:CR=1
MNQELKKDSIKRFNYIVGHIKGIQKMIENDVYCMDILNQNAAIVEAVKKINLIILEAHMNSCVARAMSKGSVKEKKRVIGELMDVLKCKHKS